MNTQEPKLVSPDITFREDKDKEQRWQELMKEAEEGKITMTEMMNRARPFFLFSSE